MQTLMQLQAIAGRISARIISALKSADLSYDLRILFDERINRKDDLRERIDRLRELELYRLREYKTQSVKTRNTKAI